MMETTILLLLFVTIGGLIVSIYSVFDAVRERRWVLYNYGGFSTRAQDRESFRHVVQQFIRMVKLGFLTAVIPMSLLEWPHDAELRANVVRIMLIVVIALITVSVTYDFVAYRKIVRDTIGDRRAAPQEEAPQRE